MHVEFRRVVWPYASTFRFADQTWDRAEAVQVELTVDNVTARGEALGVYFHGETVPSMLSQLTAVRQDLVNGVSRRALQDLMPAGGARNAVDCALWDLEAKLSGRRVWELAGIAIARPLRTAFTLSMDTPNAMGEAAGRRPHYSLLKLKLSGENDLARVAAVRKARADAEIIVDANEAWSEQDLRELAPRFADLGVRLIEQPLPAGKDDFLSSFESPVPLCADESCLTEQSLESVIGKYTYINIKLDKAGGLTEALRVARAAQSAGLQLMVGCMAGSSLSMAPAFVVGQLCSVVDLDGPLLLAADVPDAIRYEGSRMLAPDAKLWG